MLSESNYTEQLFVAAGNFVARGWSVIPVRGGDSANAKVAAVPWSVYQHQKPTSTELRSWFFQRRYGGLGVVTGRISQLVVLDFDDLGIFQQFQETCPDLVDTLTAQTRRGFHLCFRLLPALALPSRKAPGVDLQSDGRYVVAPPTVIEGYQYQARDNRLSKTLTSNDIRRIQAFLDAQGAETPPQQPTREITPSMAVSEGMVEHLTPKDVVAMYGALAGRQGRNQALFHTSLRARDAGWGKSTVQECLTNIHVRQPARGGHQGETEVQRRREALGTIESAFSRPARPRRSSAGQLPNSVREALMQQGQTATLRVIEGLQLRGVRSGQTLTYAQIIQLLSGIVGQWSIRRALSATAPDGKPMFPPSPRPSTQTNVDIEEPNTQTKKCFSVSASKPTRYKNKPPNCRYFTLPGVYELCEKLGVRRSGSDTITEEDVRAARRYRQALHREYIKRRPGQYPRSWLASRLGVSVRTQQRYNLAQPIKVQPRYSEQLIFWSNLNAVPVGIEVDGACLVDEKGRRYPARQEIAAHLLAKRHRVIYRRQTMNYYCITEAPPTAMPFTTPPRRGEIPGRAALRVTSNSAPDPEPPRLEPSVPIGSDNVLSAPTQTLPMFTLTVPSLGQPPPTCAQMVVYQPTKPEARSNRYYRKPLNDSWMEKLAQQIRTQTSGNSDGMSLWNARRLVDTYGVEACEAALRRMVWLQRRNKITNAAGFVVVVSRVMWRLQNDATDFGMTAPRFRGEPIRRRPK